SRDAGAGKSRQGVLRRPGHRDCSSGTASTTEGIVRMLRLHAIGYGFVFAALSACSNAGSILGSVLGGGQAQPSEVSGTVQGVDTRNRQIGLQQANGQTVVLTYDDQTQVVFQNRN